MAWDFRIRIFNYGVITLSVQFYILIFLILSTNFESVVSFQFDCDPVRKTKDGCNCDTSPEGAMWEVECPRGLNEVADIIIKVKSLAATTAQVYVRCNAYNPENEMPWRMLKGLDFSEQESNFNVTSLFFDKCPLSTTANTLEDFFKQVKLKTSSITTFTFLPARNAHETTSQFLSDFINSLENLETLELKDNNLITIPKLTNLPKLRKLVLIANKISQISSDVFRANKNLRLLDLASNGIVDIPDQVFPQTLQSLYLQNNNISKISEHTFSNLRNLESLILRNNPLRHMEPKTFLELSNLKALDLYSTNFEKFPILKYIPNLTAIDMSYRVKPTTENLPSEFDGSIGNLPNLVDLRLTSVGLKTIPILNDLPKLGKLRLDRNQIKEIPKDSFQGFPSLTFLDLSVNQIENVVEIKAPNLDELNLGQNVIRNLTINSLSSVAKMSILKLNKNVIETIHPKAFQTLTELKHLDLSDNKISTLSHLTNLPAAPEEKDEVLFAAEFGHQSVFRFCHQLTELNLRNNSVTEIYEDWKSLMSKLRLLDLSHNKLNKLDVFDLNVFSSNLRLDVSSNEISTVIMDSADYLLDGAENRVLVVKIDNNPLNCDCNRLAFKTFSLKGITFDYKNLKCNEPPYLKGVQFRDVPDSELVCVLDESSGCPEICSCWKVPANRTIVVDCSYRNLSDFIPSMNGLNRTAGSTYGVSLNLAGNGLSTLNSNHTKNLSDRVRQIDFSENDLADLSVLSLVASNNETLLFLAENKFSCGDCEFHKALRLHFRQISDYKNVSCLTEGIGNGKSVRWFVDKIPESEICQQDSLTAEIRGLIIAVGVLTALFVILVAIYIRHGWALRALLYSKGVGCCLMVDDSENEDSEKIYDAFVSFSHKDEEWVLSQLVDRLEEKEGFKLCLHFRDWTPGDWIPDQIVRSVDKSRRTVVILSKNFVESIWSRLEFKAAHSQALNEKGNRLILILMGEDLADSDVQDDDLKVYMKMNTYLKWGDPWFWHKLKYALPHKKSVSVENNYAKQQQRERAIKLDKLRTKMENSVA